ncbi:MADS-box domain-containing protein [Rhodotorula paludigena]|uniref:MADS-box domain-containing protein n=1 Tax=Rhodotorula paludigena TaxID=86838 RepID=UPI00317D387E
MDPSQSASPSPRLSHAGAPASSQPYLASTTQPQPQPPQSFQQYSQIPALSPVSPGFPPAAQQGGQPPPPPPPHGASSSTQLPLLPPLPIGTPTLQSPSSTLAEQQPVAPSSAFGGPSIVAFDPDADAGTDDDEDGDEGGSPKKKARKMPTRGAGASGSNAGDGGEGDAAGEDDKSRRKITIQYIHKKEKRHITFSKRKAGIMKKAYELATLTGTQVLLLVVSETGIVYTFTTTKFQPLVGANSDGTASDGQRLIQRCLEDVNSNYISPPPDAPLLPLPPSAQKRPFEANSQQHGGQIALRTKQPRPRGKARPAPIVAPGPAGSASLPTPGIHATMDQMQQLPPSPHPLNPAPPGSLAPYPPSPSYAPQFYSEGDVAMRTSRGYTDGSSLNEHYGPPPAYPPPPALGYTHQHMGSRPPHPLGPYPPPQRGSPPPSPHQVRHYPPPPPHYQSASAPRSVVDPYGGTRGHYGALSGPPGQDQHMHSPQQPLHVPPPHPHLAHSGMPAPAPPGLPQPSADMYHSGPPPSRHHDYAHDALPLPHAQLYDEQQQQQDANRRR